MPAKKQLEPGFGKRLASLRKARGLTQTQLAVAARSTQRAISSYENEHSDPPIAAVIALARALHISTDALLGLTPPKAAPLTSPDTRRLWKQFQRIASLSERDRKAVIRIIGAVVDGRGHQLG